MRKAVGDSPLILPERKMQMDGYLFVHFSGESEDGEQIYFAVSEDGLHWKDLNHGHPVLRSGIGQKGVRDPFMIRNKRTGKFVIIATDLRMANGQSWENARTNGSRSIVVWESENLVDWSIPRLVDVGLDNAGCVWAPEAVFCEEKQAYMIFWASMTKEPQEGQCKQKIFCSMTEDFVHFSDPVKYIEKENDVIDTTIVKHGMYYYRFSKNESLGVIQAEKSRDLLHGPYEPFSCEALEQLKGVEGPEAYPLDENGKWCLIVDQYGTGGGYLPLIAEHLEKGDFHRVEPKDYDMGTVTKRHGCVLPVSRPEMQRLLDAYS